MTTDSLDASRKRRHLITLDGYTRGEIEALLDRATELRARFAGGERALPLLRDRTVVNLFFEPSTRTRTSFELAARRLGAHVVNFDIANSSTVKGETIEDTLATIEAMGCDAFVVRHKESGTPARLAASARAAIVNAGDGNHAHPTQGLLDALTIRDRKGRIDGLKILICGDIRHSRVARSDVHALRALGAGEIRVCGPRALLPNEDELDGCIRFEDFDAAIEGVDVIVMLRLQKERMTEALVPSEHAYFERYGLTRERLARAARGAIAMHPGPMNRGVEIAADVADGEQSAILQQVANGIFVRMGVLVELIAPHA